MTMYKLTDQNDCTYNGYKWVPGEWHTTDGQGALCGPGWLHFYTDPLLAVFFNPIHAKLKNPKLWTAEVRGESLDDHGVKIGWTEGRIVKQIDLPTLTMNQRIEISIRAAAAYAEDIDILGIIKGVLKWPIY